MGSSQSKPPIDLTRRSESKLFANEFLKLICDNNTIISHKISQYNHLLASIINCDSVNIDEVKEIEWYFNRIIKRNKTVKLLLPENKFIKIDNDNIKMFIAVRHMCDGFTEYDYDGTYRIDIECHVLNKFLKNKAIVLIAEYEKQIKNSPQIEAKKTELSKYIIEIANIEKDISINHTQNEEYKQKTAQLLDLKVTCERYNAEIAEYKGVSYYALAIHKLTKFCEALECGE